VAAIQQIASRTNLALVWQQSLPRAGHESHGRTQLRRWLRQERHQASGCPTQDSAPDGREGGSGYRRRTSPLPPESRAAPNQHHEIWRAHASDNSFALIEPPAASREQACKQVDAPISRSGRREARRRSQGMPPPCRQARLDSRSQSPSARYRGPVLHRFNAPWDASPGWLYPQRLPLQLGRVPQLPSRSCPYHPATDLLCQVQAWPRTARGRGGLGRRVSRCGSDFDRLARCLSRISLGLRRQRR